MKSARFPKTIVSLSGAVLFRHKREDWDRAQKRSSIEAFTWLPPHESPGVLVTLASHQNKFVYAPVERLTYA